MTEYIDREVLEKLLNERLEFLRKEYGCYDHYASGYAEAVELVEETPAADVAPVVHGTWKLLGNGDGVCDQCHMLQKHIWDDDNSQRYCGCCGAIMNGGRE